MVGLIDSDGNKGKFNKAISGNDFQETIEQERSEQLWRQASTGGGQGMEEGGDLTVSNKHYNRLIKDGKTAQAAALMSIQTGALWCPASLNEAGITHEGSGHKGPYMENWTQMRVTSSGSALRFTKPPTLLSKKEIGTVLSILGMASI